MTKLFLLTFICALHLPALAQAPGATPLPRNAPRNDNPAESSKRQNDNPAEVEGARRNDNGAEFNRRNDNPAVKEPERPSASQGEPIFDWKKHEGETEVQHPFAEKGLIRIDKDDVYYYKTEDVPSRHTALTFQFGLFNPTKLKNPDTDIAQGSTFADNYAEGGPNIAFLIDREWQVWRGVLGKLGIRAGSGAFTASGHGHFVGKYQDLTPMENFTFIAFPNDIGLVYRMQFLHRQLFVPYVMGGGTLIAFAEIRDDNKAPKFAGSFAAFAAAGMQINLTYFDYLTRVQLAREYGISNIYLTLEDRQQIGVDTRYDFTLNMANLGFLIEY